MKMYRAGFYGITVQAVDVERVSEASVWIEGQRHARITDYDAYFGTFEEARAWIEERYKNKIVDLHKNMDYYRGLLHRAQILTPKEVQA